MRRSLPSRRLCRGVVPSHSAASSKVISLSILAILLLLGGGHGAKFLAGHRSLFARPGGGRQRQPALALGLVASPDKGPGGDHDGGLVVLGPIPGIQGDAGASPATLGEGDSGSA